MKAWHKGAIVGAVWGLISSIVWLILAVGAMPHAPSGISKSAAYFYMIIFFPGYVSISILLPLINKIINLYYLPRIIQFLIYFVLPITLGAIIGVLILRIIELAIKRAKIGKSFIFLIILLPFFSIVFNPVYAYVNKGGNISINETVSALSANTPGRDLLADGPWRIDPGQNIPITYVIKDTNEHPLYIRKIEVYHDETPIGSESGDTLVHTRTLEQWFVQNLWYSIDYLSPSSFNDPDEYIEIHVKFDIRLESDVHKYFVVRASSYAMPSLPNWYYGDTHYHSIYSDNFCEFGMPIEATAETGKRIGLDWVTVTDHSFDLDSSRWASLVSDSNTYSGSEFRVLPAEEVSAYIWVQTNLTYNHYLAYNITSFIAGGELEDLTLPDFTPSEVVSKVNNQGGFGYIAHPIASDQFRSQWQDYSLNFTGLQVWNGILSTSEDKDRLQQGKHWQEDHEACQAPRKQSSLDEYNQP